MFNKEIEKTVEYYIQAFVGSLIVAYAVMELLDEPYNYGYWFFFDIGVIVILIAHRSYKKRRNVHKER